MCRRGLCWRSCRRSVHGGRSLGPAIGLAGDAGMVGADKLKIAQIMYTGFGGVGSVVFSLIEADKPRRHEWIIGCIGDLPMDEAYPERCAANGVRWGEFRSRPGRPYGAWIALARWLDRERPDAVLLHSINAILPCRWYGWRRKAPVVAVEHTPNAVKTRSEWAASYLSMVLADKVVLLTPDYGRELAKVHGFLHRPEKVTVIANGIDTDVFRPGGDRRHGPGTVRLGMAARFSFSKRQDLLIEMMTVLQERWPQVNWHLSLAGDGDRFSDMRASVCGLGLQQSVSFDGLLDEPHLAGWLRGLDIYVHASDGETLSTSLLQAMATGLPIVASDIPGIRNLIAADGELGVLAPNVACGFAAAVAGLAEDEKRREALASNARNACVSSYGSGAMLDRYVELLCREP